MQIFIDRSKTCFNVRSCSHLGASRRFGCYPLQARRQPPSRYFGDANKRTANNQKNLKIEREQDMNSSSTDQLPAALPVLGLDVAKATVQAELRTNGNKVRFGFANNARGFAQLARILKERNLTKVWTGLEATGPYSHALAPALVAIKHNAPPVSLRFPASRRWQTKNEHGLRHHAKAPPYRLRCAQTSKALQSPTRMTAPPPCTSRSYLQR